MTKYVTIDDDRTTKLSANKANVSYVINATIHTLGLAIDASHALKGRQITINGAVQADDGIAIQLGDASLADSNTFIKIAGSLTSGGKGLVAASGGVTFNIASSGVIQTNSTSFVLSIGNNVFENDGKLTSNEDSAIVSSGNNDNINNTGGATLTATGNAIVSTGNRTSITNSGTTDSGGMANITSTSASAIVARGKHDTIYNTSGISALANAIVSSGVYATITSEGNGSISSNNGRGISSSGAHAEITNNAAITAKREGICSSGAYAEINNSASINSWKAAAIRSTGDYADITNSTTLNGETVGIQSSGNHAKINNYGDINGNNVGVRIDGNHSSLITTSHITADTAIAISGNDAHVTIKNEISGGGKKAATIDITADGTTHVTNSGSVNSSLSGVVLQGGNGSEHITNTGSLNGDVILGGGDDVFKSMKGDVTGKVVGGAGNDTYITGVPLDIVEKAHGGTDTVESKYTYTLGANIENLILLGKGTMDATGNNLANHIEGNAGNNHLTGGGGKDVFVFENGSRHDTITDFTDHADKIDLSGYHGIDQFSDLDGKIVRSGDDVTITLDGGDVITVDHMRVSHLTAADFIF